MRKLIVILIAMACLGISGMATAAELSDRDATILKEAGIPLYQGVEFVNGGPGDENVGAWFASSTAVEDVRAFYRKKFPSWALHAKYGGWILYKGNSGAGLAAVMGKQHISVKENKNIPEWFGLDESKTTEIIIVVPGQ